MRLALKFALLAVAYCYESAWIQRHNISQCPELCTDASGRNCLMAAVYNWTTREFDVSLKLCTQDTVLNCFEVRDISWITRD